MPSTAAGHRSLTSDDNAQRCKHPSRLHRAALAVRKLRCFFYRFLVTRAGGDCFRKYHLELLPRRALIRAESSAADVRYD